MNKSKPKKSKQKKPLMLSKKKQDTKTTHYIYDSIYVKFKNRHSLSTVIVQNSGCLFRVGWGSGA